MCDYDWRAPIRRSGRMNGNIVANESNCDSPRPRHFGTSQWYSTRRDWHRVCIPFGSSDNIRPSRRHCHETPKRIESQRRSRLATRCWPLMRLRTSLSEEQELAARRQAILQQDEFITTTADHRSGRVRLPPPQTWLRLADTRGNMPCSTARWGGRYYGRPYAGYYYGPPRGMPLSSTTAPLLSTLATVAIG